MSALLLTRGRLLRCAASPSASCIGAQHAPRALLFTRSTVASPAASSSSLLRVPHATSRALSVSAAWRSPASWRARSTASQQHASSLTPQRILPEQQVAAQSQQQQSEHARSSASAGASSSFTWLLWLQRAGVCVAAAAGSYFLLDFSLRLRRSLSDDSPLRSARYGSLTLNPLERSFVEAPRSMLIIMGINLAVYVAHQRLPLHVSMRHLYTSWPHVAEWRLYYTLVTSVFSHESFWHLAANMYGVWLFYPMVTRALGERDTVVAYMVGGVFASVVGLASTRWLVPAALRRRAMEQPSLGASGSVCTLVGLTALLIPDLPMQLIILPIGSIDMSTVFLAAIGFDLTGLIVQHYRKSLSGIGHGAHLGGFLFAWMWYHAYLMRNNPGARAFRERAHLRRAARESAEGRAAAAALAAAERRRALEAAAHAKGPVELEVEIKRR